MMDFRLGSDGDILIEDGKFSLLNTIQEAVRQRLQIGLQTFLEEYFLDTTVGIPYRQQIFNKGLTKSEVDALYLRKINADTDVIKVTYFSSVQTGRKYDLDFEVLTTDGLLRVNLPNITTNDEVEYNEATDVVITPSCRTGGVMSGQDGQVINKSQGKTPTEYAVNIVHTGQVFI